MQGRTKGRRGKLYKQYLSSSDVEVPNRMSAQHQRDNETAGGGAEDVGHQAGLGQGAERPNRNPSQNETAGEGAEDLGEHQTAQGQGAKRSNPHPSQ
ncbi:hypothetical protein NQZ68_008311, partial [Dissostichus eleginoides]